MVLFKAGNGPGLMGSIGEYGRQVDARPQRTKDQKEAYCLRRYLLSLANCGLLDYPLAVEKCETPDFIVTGTECFGIEVTEATDEVDQREYTKAAKSGVTMWSDGRFGGRGTFVGVSHERLWLSYVRKAIQKKQKLTY